MRSFPTHRKVVEPGAVRFSELLNQEKGSAVSTHRVAAAQKHTGSGLSDYLNAELDPLHGAGVPVGRFSPSESPQPHQQQLEHSSDPLPDPRNLKQSAEPTKRTRVEEQHSVQLAPTEFAFIDEPPRQPDPVQPAASEVGGAPKRVAARLPAFGEVWGRFAAFRWNSAPPTTASESNMSDKSNQDSSSVELALEADPSMVASRPTSATEESLQEQATREAQVQQATPATSDATPTPTTTPPSAAARLPSPPAPPIPAATPKKPMMSISSATASTLALATTTTVGSHTSAAVMRAAKKKVVELECAEARWHYKKPGESKWTPFRGYDSMVLEVSYRAQHNIPLDKKTQALSDKLPQTTNVIVLDNLFEWDPQKHQDEITSVYWKDESMKILRGTWFYADTMQPLDKETLADAIEQHHLDKFRNQVIPDSPVFNENEANKKPVLTSLKWEEQNEVRWNSVIDVSYYNNTKANRFLRNFTRGKGVSPLKRGFSHEADLDEGRPNFSDLILVVHGIGQKGYENLIAKNTTQIREVIEHLMEKHYTHEKRRPMILPIEWRSSLVLDNGMTDTITLPRMPNVRQTLNSIAMDIMYYQSPLYRTEITNGVIRCLNSTYSKFVQNNPGFSGPVSLFCHSLGSVIAYDIVTNWSPLLLYDEFVTKAIEHRKQEAQDDEQKKIFGDFYECRKKLLEQGGHMQEILLRRDEELHFKVKNLFCIGSPLGVFVLMRGSTADRLLPTKDQCERLYNVFHPYDPVAYRLEPMYHENYKNIRPVKLFNYAEVNRDYNVLGFDCHKSYLRKRKKAAKKGAESEKTNDSDEKRKGEEEDDEDSDSGDCSSVNSPDYTRGSPRSGSPLVPEEQGDLEHHHHHHLQHAQQNGASPPSNGTKPEPVAPASASRWWRFGSITTAEKKALKEEMAARERDSASTAAGGKDDSSNLSGNTSAKGESTTGEPEEQQLPRVALSPAEQLIDAIPAEQRVPYRLDFQLNTSLTEKGYLSVLKSHFGYWTNYDVTAFLLNQLYPPPPAKL